MTTTLFIEILSYAVENSDIDIYVPQDGAGSTFVTTFWTSKEHFRALKDAINLVNGQLHKHVEAWANIETFNLSWIFTPENPDCIPAAFRRLQWQLRAADPVLPNAVTWLYQWSMSDINGVPHPEYRPGRRKLKYDYLNKPIILGVFWWHYPPNPPGMLVVKGYNFGEQGKKALIYLHYTDFNGVKKYYSTEAEVKFVGDKEEMWLPFTGVVAQIDHNREMEAAVKNKNGLVGYYVSNNPESKCEPLFPEV